MSLIAISVALALLPAPALDDAVEREARAAMGETIQEASDGRYHVTLESPASVAPGSARRLAELLRALEESYRGFWRGAVSLSEPSSSVRIFEFHRKGVLRGLLTRAGVSSPSFEAGGVYLPGSRVLLVESDGVLERSRVALLVHEAAHFLNREVLDGTAMSPWLNEGLAQMIEYAPIESGPGGPVFRLGEIDAGSELRIPDGEAEIVHQFLPSRSLSYLQGQIMRDRSLSLGPLLEVRDAPAFYGAGAQLRYAQAWTLVHMLSRGSSRDGRPYRPTLDRLIEAERQGVRGRDALLGAVGLTLEQLDEAWYRHLKSLR